MGPLLGDAVGKNDNKFDGEQLGVCEDPEIDGEYDGNWLGPNVKIIGVCVGPTVGKGVTTSVGATLEMLGSADGVNIGKLDEVEGN